MTSLNCGSPHFSQTCGLESPVLMMRVPQRKASAGPLARQQRTSMLGMTGPAVVAIVPSLGVSCRSPTLAQAGKWLERYMAAYWWVTDEVSMG